jgi:hypothetical protein
MGQTMSGAADAVMIVMMLAMAGFSLAFLGRAVPAAWRERFRRRASLRADGKEGAR